MIEAKVIAGALFLLIILLNVISDWFGYETFSKTDSAAFFNKINGASRNFRLSIVFIVLEHLSLIGVAVSLFVAFNETSLILALIWLGARSLEGVTQLFFKIEYSGLLGLAGRYRSAKGPAKKEIANKGQKILDRKNVVFEITQILFSIGTFAYSLMIAMYPVVTSWLGWFGMAAALVYGVGNVVKLVSDKQDIWNVGGLFILLYEVMLGGWLLIGTLVTGS